jgi:hypothetical protein
MGVARHTAEQPYQVGRRFRDRLAGADQLDLPKVLALPCSAFGLADPDGGNPLALHLELDRQYLPRAFAGAGERSDRVGPVGTEPEHGDLSKVAVAGRGASSVVCH